MESYDINEIFAISDESPRYSEKALEIHDRLINIIQKLEVLLYTEKGSLLCMPDFGIDLEKYIFETNVSANYIQNEINLQIQKYVKSTTDSNINIYCKVNFFERPNNYSFGCVVDIYIEDYLVTSYAF
jgi:phage baseplate assembly protein W